MPSYDLAWLGAAGQPYSHGTVDAASLSAALWEATRILRGKIKNGPLAEPHAVDAGLYGRGFYITEVAP